MPAFTSTRAGARYVLDVYNAALTQNGQDLQASLETLTSLLDADRYFELCGYIQDILNQYADVNGIDEGDDEQFMDEANTIACYLQNHARPKLVMA